MKNELNKRRKKRKKKMKQIRNKTEAAALNDVPSTG